MLLGVAKQTLDHLANHLTAGVTAMPRGACTEVALALGTLAGFGIVFVSVLRHTRGDVDFASGSHETFGIEVLVRARGLAGLPRQGFQHGKGGFALGGARSSSELGIGRRP
jgi:hypothetical protein